MYISVDAEGRATGESRLILGDDGRFAFQYGNAPASVEYRGTYVYFEGAGTIAFTWDGGSLAGRGTTGVLEGDAIRVSFDLVMQLNDFEDTSYKRVL